MPSTCARVVVDKRDSSKYADPEEFIQWMIDGTIRRMHKGGYTPGKQHRSEDAHAVVIDIEANDVPVA